MNIFSWLRRAVRSAWFWITIWGAFWWIAGIVLVLATSLALSWCYWEELRSDQESLSTTVRNVGLVIGGVIAILFAAWRSIVAEKQAETAQWGLLNERYQKGAEMLGSTGLAVRLGGIYALQRLAQEHDEYHVPIMRLFCAFVCNPTETTDEKPAATNREDDRSMPLLPDVAAIMEAIATRKLERVALERGDGYCLDLRNANLGGLDLFRIGNVDLSWSKLTGANLSYIRLPPETNFSWVSEAYGANLSKARLSRVNFEFGNLSETDLSNSLLVGANLQCADLGKANLLNATLADADLSGATFRDTNLSGTKFSLDDHPPARGLTQTQLDEAKADPDNPPKIDHVVVDAVTGKPLVWRGKPLEKEK